jgi:hypothetical protein
MRSARVFATASLPAVSAQEENASLPITPRGARLRAQVVSNPRQSMGNREEFFSAREVSKSPRAHKMKVRARYGDGTVTCGALRAEHQPTMKSPMIWPSTC